MMNPKRNDPCPCGSGKKHKKCCGMSNVISISPQPYNDELDHLHDDLLAYALGNYDDLFIEQTKAHFQPFLNEQSTVTEDYLTGLTFWTILNVPLLKDNQTIFDAFYQQYKGRIKRTRTRNTFSEWANTPPSVYEVITTNFNKGMATIVELSTNQEYQIPMVDEDDYRKEDLIIGSLVPFVGFHDFLFDMIELFEGDKEEVISLMADYSINSTNFSNMFPEFLAATLTPNKEIEYVNPLHRFVIELFVKHMKDKGFDDQVINMGTEVWQVYTLMADPQFKNINAYAAALEYFIHNTVNEGGGITQKQVAKEYEASVGTVSTNYRKIVNFIEKAAAEKELQSQHHGSVSMEREMRQIQQMLAKEKFDSIEEANNFLNQMLNSGDVIDRTSMSPRDKAQDLLYEARESSGPRRQGLIEEALSIYPDSPDAYLLLAEDTVSETEYDRLLRKALQVGEKDLGKAFFLENKGHFWMMIETRPYMRAKAMYADFLYEIGFDEDAFEHYEEMLRLNPNDNQGIRYVLLTLYIESGKYKEAVNLINTFKDEGTATFLFSKVLLDYLINGMTAQTGTFIKAANKQNPFIKDYLQGKKEIPDEYPEHMGIGEETEAIIYTQENIHLWSECPELLKEL